MGSRLVIQLSRAVLVITLAINVPAGAGVLTGTVKDDKGRPMEGVMVRVTDDIRRVSESVFTNSEGVYTLVTSLKGLQKLRVRTPFFHDAKTRASIPETGTSTTNVEMFPLTNESDISESLPAAYRFGDLPFETGGNKDFSYTAFSRR